MPKSKRAKVITLSQTKKKGKEAKTNLFDGIRESVEAYERCFVFSVENMRNTYLKDVRSTFSDSRIYLGKTKVMAKALGTSPEDEHRTNLHKLSTFLAGNVGLLFTNRPISEIIEYFASYAETDFARAGVEATRDFTIPAGTIFSRAGEIPEEDDIPLAHTMEPEIRSLGVPTRLVRGKIEVDSPFRVCKEGDTLSSNQTRLLKMFGVATAEFKINLIAYWDSANEEVTEVDAMEE